MLSQSRLTRILGDWSGVDSEALFRRLADRLRAQIKTGQIPAGTKLPSERALANSLGVSRSTVTAALEELRSDGLISSKQGSGTFISSAGIYRQARGDSRLETFGEPAHLGHIDLRSAALPGLALVADEIAALDRASVSRMVESHGYIPGGIPELREAVAAYFRDLALPTQPDDILITAGAQQGLRLLLNALLERGAPVLAEEPTFRGAIETFRAQGVRISPIPTGPEGIDLAALERGIRVSRARLLFVQASGNNPTGATMPVAARRKLAELANRHGVFVVEDAAVADASMTPDILPPLAAYGVNGATIGSASKNFWGGLRVGWLRADPTLIHQLAMMKGAEDLGTSIIGQLVTARLLPQINAARRIRRLELSSARAFTLETIKSSLPDWQPVTPFAGASLWVKIPAGSATAFSQQAMRRGVSVLPGPTFSSVDGLDDHLRIAFASSLATIAEGLNRLADVWLRYRQPEPENLP